MLHTQKVHAACGGEGRSPAGPRGSGATGWRAPPHPEHRTAAPVWAAAGPPAADPRGAGGRAPSGEGAESRDQEGPGDGWPSRLGTSCVSPGGLRPQGRQGPPQSSPETGTGSAGSITKPWSPGIRPVRRHAPRPDPGRHLWLRCWADAGRWGAEAHKGVPMGHPPAPPTHLRGPRSRSSRKR